MTRSSPRATRIGHRTRACLTLLALLALSAGWAPAALGAEAPAEARLSVKDMWCAKCEKTVESILKDLDGVMGAEADRKAETALVAFDPVRTSPRQMVRAVNTETYYKAKAVSVTRAASPDLAASENSDRGGGFAAGYGGIALGAVLLLGGAYLLASRLRRRAARE